MTPPEGSAGSGRLPMKPPIVAPGHSPGSVTDQITSVVLGRTPKWWWAAFGGSFLLVLLLLQALTKLLLEGTGIWGLNIPVGWGFAIINFVWWIGIGHAGTLISAILLLVASGVAHLHQSIRGGHDSLCGRLRRDLPLDPRGAPLVGLLAPALSQHHGSMAPVSQSSGLGCLCGLDLCHRLGPFLVRGSDPRSGDVARPHPGQVRKDHLRHAGHGLAWLRHSLAQLRNRLPAARGSGHAIGAVGAHRGQLRFRRRHHPRVARHHLSRPTSSPEPSLPASPWSSPWPYPCAPSSGSRTSSPPGICRTWARFSWQQV